VVRWFGLLAREIGAVGGTAKTRVYPRAVRNRFRIEENVRGGVAYLAWLMRRFQGDLRLVTAAYFAGENRVALSGLNYRSPEVYGYVSRVAKLYRKKRLETLRSGR